MQRQTEQGAGPRSNQPVQGRAPDTRKLVADSGVGGMGVPSGQPAVKPAVVQSCRSCSARLRGGPQCEAQDGSPESPPPGTALLLCLHIIQIIQK